MSKIQELKNKVLQGGMIDKEEARYLISLEAPEALEELSQAANEIRIHFRGEVIDFCSIINAKSGNCSENCTFCSQSAHYNTGIDTYKYIDAETALAKAKEAKRNGATSFGLVVADRGLSDRNFEHIVSVMQRIKEEVDINVDGSLGLLTETQAKRLKEIGVGMINHNLETSREFFSNICTTHSWDERLETLRNLKRNGIPLCSGGILGVGESPEDRLSLAFVLREEEVTTIPINILDPRPGTPLESFKPLNPEDSLKTIAVFRFINPKAIIKLAGGREGGLAEKQQKALESGANSLLIGGYLTTMGNQVPSDFEMVEKAGFKIEMDESDYQQVKESGKNGTAKRPTALVSIK